MCLFLKKFYSDWETNGIKLEHFLFKMQKFEEICESFPAKKRDSKE